MMTSIFLLSEIYKSFCKSKTVQYKDSIASAIGLYLLLYKLKTLKIYKNIKYTIKLKILEIVVSPLCRFDVV